MKKILLKIGLIIRFEYSFNLSYDSVLKLLTSDNAGDDNLWIFKVLGARNHLTSRKFKLENNKFHIEKKGFMNPLSGRGHVNGEIISKSQNETNVIGEVSSNYNELYFIIFGIFFLGLLWSPFFYFGMIGFEFIMIGLGFFLIVTLQMIFFQRYEARKVKRDFDKFLERLKS
jgi:hypothetical protein